MNEDRSIIERAAIFEAEAHALLGSYEDAHTSRVIKLGDVLDRLTAQPPPGEPLSPVVALRSERDLPGRSRHGVGGSDGPLRRKGRERWPFQAARAVSEVAGPHVTS